METSSDSTATPRDRFNNWIAVSVALLAAFMAVTKVKDDNIVQAMLQAKSDAVDTWSQYQSKRIKQHLLELGRDQSEALLEIVPQRNAARINARLGHYESEIVRYQADEKELMNKARAYETQYDALNYRDDQFDLSDAVLSVSLATLAVTALTRRKWLFWLSLTFAGFGVVMGTAGLMGWNIHPNWLIKMLS